MLDGGDIHLHLDEDGVILYEATLVKLCKRDEVRTPTGYVHVCLGSLEAAAQWIWLKHINNVSSMMLVDETEQYLVFEWPLEDGIRLSLHDHKEQ